MKQAITTTFFCLCSFLLQPALVHVFSMNNQSPHILKTGISWPQDRVLPQFARPAEILDGISIADSSMLSSEKILFAALQGLVNKKQPRIFLFDVVREGKNKWPNLLQLNITEFPAAKKWELVKKYKAEISGLILYSTENSPHYINLASTVGGLKNALPVTKSDYDNLIANGIKLPILVDLSQLNFQKNTEIYSYLYEHYWKDCTKRLLVSHSYRHAGYIRDMGVASGAAIVWLDPRVGDENQVLRKFLADMKAGESIMIGWWAEERSGIGIGTEYGISTIPSDFYENSTVYAGTAPQIELPVVPKKPKLENKIYLAIFLSDGDNVQYCQHAMSNLWDNKNRGIIPINWTISPGLADFGPGLLNYYYSTASPNDFFASGPSGLGYALLFDEHNKKWHVTDNKHIDAYTRLSQRYIEKSGLRVITIWDELSEEQMDIYTTNCRYLYGVTREDWEKSKPFQTIMKQNKLAFIPNHPCYASDIEDIYVRWEKQIKMFDGTRPLFLSAQGESWKMGPENIVALQEKLEKLAPGKIVICRGDHFFTLFNELNHLDFNLTLSPEMKIKSSPSMSNPANAADGSDSEKHQWVSSGTGKQWIELDFNQTYEINRYVVRHAGSDESGKSMNTKDFKLEVSLDGKNWSIADQQTGNKAEVSDIDFNPSRARYVRLTITNPGKDGIARIADIEIYGKTVLSNKFVYLK